MKNYFQGSKLKTLIVTSSLLAIPAASAWAVEGGGLSLGVLGAIAVNSPSYSQNGNSSTVDGKTSYGGGVTLEQRVNQTLALEEDLLYLNRDFSQKTAQFFGSSVTSTVTSGYFHIPVLLRFRPIPFLNLGAGGYYSRTISSWNVSATGFSDKTITNYGNNDFGFELGAGANIPLGERLNIVADLRYSRSLTDNARASNDDLKFTDVRFLAGIRYDF